MNVTEAIRARRSIRKYKKGTVIPKEHIELILEAAMMAPSAGNTRPWEFIVIENRGILQKLTEINPYSRMLNTASAAILICARPELQSGICDGFWPQDRGGKSDPAGTGAGVRHMLVRYVPYPAPGTENTRTAQYHQCPLRSYCPGCTGSTASGERVL